LLYRIKPNKSVTVLDPTVVWPRALFGVCIHDSLKKSRQWLYLISVIWWYSNYHLLWFYANN